MMTRYLGGVGLGLLGGVLMQLGQILQKKAVNRVRINSKNSFLRSLVQDRTWLVGFFIVGGGTAAFILAQFLIGPALVPGLTAFGLVVLAVGSVRLNREVLNSSEVLGIFLMVAGVLFLGLSGLDIPREQVSATLADRQALIRIGIFTGVFLLLFVFSRSLVSRHKGHQGVLIALGNGFLSCLGNFWIAPLLVVALVVLKGSASTFHWAVLITAAFIVTVCGWVITWQSQEAFKVAQASNVVPVGQVPVQVAPIVVYFFVFALGSPGFFSLVSIVTGTVLTIAAGFLLGRRQQVLIL
jgi:hypothetical protein